MCRSMLSVEERDVQGNLGDQEPACLDIVVLWQDLFPPSKTTLAILYPNVAFTVQCFGSTPPLSTSSSFPPLLRKCYAPPCTFI